MERPGRKHNHILKFQKVHLHTAVKVIISVVRGLKVGLFLPSLFLGPAQLFLAPFLPGYRRETVEKVLTAMLWRRFTTTVKELGGYAIRKP